MEICIQECDKMDTISRNMIATSDKLATDKLTVGICSHKIND